MESTYTFEVAYCYGPFTPDVVSAAFCGGGSDTSSNGTVFTPKLYVKKKGHGNRGGSCRIRLLTELLHWRWLMVLIFCMYTKLSATCKNLSLEAYVRYTCLPCIATCIVHAREWDLKMWDLKKILVSLCTHTFLCFPVAWPFCMQKQVLHHQVHIFFFLYTWLYFLTSILSSILSSSFLVLLLLFSSFFCEGQNRPPSNPRHKEGGVSTRKVLEGVELRQANLNGVPPPRSRKLLTFQNLLMALLITSWRKVPGSSKLHVPIRPIDIVISCLLNFPAWLMNLIEGNVWEMVLHVGWVEMKRES